MQLDSERLCLELQRLEWARGLDAEILQDIAAAGQLQEFQPGQSVIELDAEIKHVCFVVNGRLEGGLFDRLGKEIHHDVLRRGSVVGLFSVLLPDRSRLQVSAVEPTTAILLTLDDLLRLTARHREFQLAMFRLAANVVKRLVMVERDLPKPAVVGVFHHSDATRPLAASLARRLQQLGEAPFVAGDDERWQPGEGVPHRLLFERGGFIGAERVKSLLEEAAGRHRLLLDSSADHSAEDLQRLLHYADVVLWCLQPADAPKALQILEAAERAMPRLHEKVCLVWNLTGDAPAPPYVAELYALAARHFKVHAGAFQSNQGKLLHQGVERIVHYLRGVQIGLALGGGAARGMAHLGVLKALEQHGIFVDMLAGTSAGAMVGGLYAAGLNPQVTTVDFKRDLQPSWFFRQLAGGGYWYLLYKYRSGQFGPMLRKYLHQWRMEQLAIPTLMVSVDLVDGVPLIRDRGDAVANILESINLPPLSLPIVQSEQAVVDGGLLNNVPADALVARGCNFVIASTVTAQLEREFMGIRSKRSQGLGRFIASVQVMMRQNLIQSYNMNAHGVQPADVVIAPDVTAFDLSEFTRADEMAVVGENAANAAIQQLKSMLARLDPQLFS